MRYPDDYDTIYADGFMPANAISDYLEEPGEYEVYFYEAADADMNSLEEYEHLVPASYVVDLVPESWVE